MNEQGILMNDLLSKMASDSGQTTDKLDTLDTSKLDGVSRLANDAANLEQEISDAERLLKQKKDDLRKITDEQLPEILEEMGLQKFTLTDGSEISVSPLYAASIPVDRREDAYQWLRDHGFGDLVKNNVTVSFGVGEDDAAKEFTTLCDLQGYAPNQIEKVEPSTLRGWLRERVEAGDPVPLDLFGAYIAQRAKIKRSK
jgi:hypothetical protein